MPLNIFSPAKKIVLDVQYVGGWMGGQSGERRAFKFKDAIPLLMVESDP